VDVLLVLASHGWWPWLLLYGAIAVIVVLAVAYFVKRRRAV
jgi:hypothetical protein